MALVNVSCIRWRSGEHGIWTGTKKISGKKILQRIRPYIRPILGRIVGWIDRGSWKKFGLATASNLAVNPAGLWRGPFHFIFVFVSLFIEMFNQSPVLPYGLVSSILGLVVSNSLFSLGSIARTIGFVRFDSVVLVRAGQAVRWTLWFTLGRGGAVTEPADHLSTL